MDERMDPQTALGRAEHIGERVRKKARWHGWVWLVVGFATPAFLIGTHAGFVPRPAQFWIAIGFLAIAATLTIWDSRRGVLGLEAARVDKPHTWAYVLSMGVVASISIILSPVGAPTWFVLISFVPSLPCLAAAWRILRP